MSDAKIVVMMSREKDTKNKVQFREDGGTDIETLYVPKATLVKLGATAASRIKITIEPA
mgnify:CR=1 FL=1|jgi:hypothetical protein